MMAEGVNDPLEALPIDIAYNKLADWLVDRKKIPTDWRKKLASVRVKTSAALSTLAWGVDPAFRNLTPESTGYLEAKHVRDALLSKMPESKNLFGRPTGAAGEWQSIVSAYEKDLIFLGEAAQIMVQSTNYDIPYQKKQLAKFQQQLTDLEHKESDAKRNINQSAAKYQQACQELGIQGLNIRAELKSLEKTLPKVFAEVVDGLCGDFVGSALEYYQAFYSYASELPEDKSTPVLPTLTDIRLHPPDVGVKVGEPVESKHQGEGLSASENDINRTEIDWGIETQKADAGARADSGGDIDWDIGTLEEINPDGDATVQTNAQDVETIKASKDNTNAVDTDRGLTEDMRATSEVNWDVDLSTDINWDIDVEEDGILLSANGDLPPMPQPNPENGVNPLERHDGGPGAPTSWFAIAQNRNNLLDDLLELKVFLKIRLKEMMEEESTALQVVAPSSIPQHGSESLTAMASGVSDILKLITNRKTRDLILLSTSSRYFDRLEASLTHRKQNELNLQKSVGDFKSKRLELLNSQASLWPKQEAVLARTRFVKQLVEDVLSAQYSGRKVNVIGEINTMLG